MRVSSFEIRDFRSWEHAQVRLGEGSTLFLGRNGYGKTNLVEALGVLSSLSSHRGAQIAAMVRRGAPEAAISADVLNEGRKLTVGLRLTPGKATKAQLNGVNRPTREVAGILRTVFFSPEDLALVRGEPGERRRFLDETLVVRQPRMAGVKADFERVLRQRATLLKSLNGGRPGASRSDEARATLEAWDEQFASRAAALTVARMDLVRVLSPIVGRCYAAIDPNSDDVELRYRRSAEESDEPLSGDEPAAGISEQEVAESIVERLAGMREEELRRGQCLVGPHRDDLELRIAGGLARAFVSHGEAWSYALALRVAAFELLRDEGHDPVLILDDVFAELDGPRREVVAGLVRRAEQTLITAADPATVPEGLIAQVVPVRLGESSGTKSSRIAGAAETKEVDGDG
ncbi:MAG: DNA replication/repair protein RecF [Segniliparus sp.]|uniref:DNA replication/repair protein RecF n=1 Tax=Segniliparus sp. TaxID=2804064 RepID=UPI003F35D1B3